MNLSKKEKNIFYNTFFGAVKMFLGSVGLLCLFGILLGGINTASERNMYGALGWAGVIITGCIGTPIHELSHYIMCKVFCVNVTEVSLFRPTLGKADGILGYVSFEKSGGFLKSIGYFFIGFAPLIIGTLVIIILFRCLVPKAYNELKDEKQMIMSDEKLSINLIFRVLGEIIKSIFKVPMEEDSIALIKYFIFMFAMFSISTHMVLSSSDLNGTVEGMIVLFILFLIVSLIFELRKIDYRKGLLRMVVVICSFFSVSIIFSLVSLAISYVFYLIF